MSRLSSDVSGIQSVADQILVMDRGRLVERDTHRQLLARGDLYARLYRMQFEPEARAG